MNLTQKARAEHAVCKSSECKLESKCVYLRNNESCVVYGGGFEAGIEWAQDECATILDKAIEGMPKEIRDHIPDFCVNPCAVSPEAVRWMATVLTELYGGQIWEVRDGKD